MQTDEWLLWTFAAIVAFGVIAAMLQRRRGGRDAKVRETSRRGHFLTIVATALVMALAVYFFGPS